MSEATIRVDAFGTTGASRRRSVRLRAPHTLRLTIASSTASAAVVLDISEGGQKRSLHAFSKWTPGPAEFKAFYGFADSTGGVALVEAASAADLAKTFAPWTPWLRFTARPIVPIEESAAINMAAGAWREGL